MEKPAMVLDKNGNGTFYLMEGTEQVGKMIFRIEGNTLTAFHTEVLPEFEGKGFAKQLLDAMVEYVREHQLKVLPLCPYVQMQFKRHPEQYADIWKK